MKVLFRKSNGKLLGAQAVGDDGVDKRISSLAILQMGATVYDLEEAELCYAPQFGSAKDPVNFAGMIAADVLRDDMPLSHWDAAGKNSCSTCANPPNWRWRTRRVRSTSRWASCARAWASCRATRNPRRMPLRATRVLRHAILLQNGFKAKNLAGGMLSRTHAATFWTS